MAISARTKKARAKKARAFIGPPTLKSQHKSHATRRAKAAGMPLTKTDHIKKPDVVIEPSGKVRVKVKAGSRKVGAAKGKTVYKTAIGPKPANSQHKSHATRRLNKANAAKGSKVYDSPIGPSATKPRVRVKAGSRRVAGSAGGGGGRSAAAKKAWATRRANGWKAPSRKKG